MQSVIGILVFVRDAILALVMAWIGIGFPDAADRNGRPQKNAVAASCPDQLREAEDAQAGAMRPSNSYLQR